MTEGIVGFQEHKIRCIIGCLPEERIKEQDILIDAKVRVNMASCVKSDDISEAVDYLKMTEICTIVAQRKQFHLLESLASAILDQLFKQFAIKWAWICIKKPMALATAKYSYVEMERTAI